MKRNSFASKFFSMGVVALIALSCNRSNDRIVVPDEIDIDEVYQPLSPNDPEDPSELTFGKDNVPGFIFNYEMMSDKEDIFIYFENFTVLDVNPSITSDLFNFAYDNLKEYGFINENSSIAPDKFKEICSHTSSYKGAAAKLLDDLKEQFDGQLDSIYRYDTPFNAYLNIYPVYLDHEFVTYRESAYLYTGGAHGMTVSYLKTFRLSDGSVMTLDDLIKKENIRDFREEVAAHMAYSYPIYENIKTVNQYLDSLNTWLDNFSSEDDTDIITVENYPVPDVALIKDGIACVYQMYELTPGSDGCPVVVIPYKDLKGWLK